MNILPDIDPFRQRYNELEAQLSNPDIFKDGKLATELSKEHSRIKKYSYQFRKIFKI